MTILISGAGTSDPVRGDRDGALLHIIRHYHPEKVYLLLTTEMVKFDDQDHRFEIMENFVRNDTKCWGNYSFSLQKYKMDLKDPSDLDACSEKMTPLIKQILESEESTDLRILYNLSSGTPQMKMVLAMNVLDTQYNAVGIQVKNPERRAGTTARVTKDYPIEESLELNNDEEEGAVNRCEEPQMYYLRRKQKKDQMTSLLQGFDYSALDKLNQIPTTVKPLVRHLRYRSILNHDEAEKYAKEARKSDPKIFDLYPYFLKNSELKNSSDKGHERKLEELIEYYLALKNLERAGSYNDFVLRLNPFFTELETQIFIKEYGKSLDRIAVRARNRVWTFNRSRFEVNEPELSQFVDSELEKEGMTGYMNTAFNQLVLNILLRYFENLSEKTMEFFSRICKLNSQIRNPAAHSLFCVTKQDILRASGLTSHRIITETEEALMEIFPDIDKKIFSVYERCNAYILEQLE